MSGEERTPPYVVTGRVIKAYGILGWVKIEPFTVNPERFRPGCSFILEGVEEGRLVLEDVEERPDGLLAKFRGRDTRSEAETLKGCWLMVDPDELGEAPPGAYWEHQVIGLEVFTSDGTCLGSVVEVLETGANDVLVVKGEKEVLIPMIEQVVSRIDLAAGRMLIEPLPGLLEE